MDLILITVFSYLIHKMASKKGIPSVSYILNYIATILLVVFGMAIFMVNFWGADWFTNEANRKTILIFSGVTILIEVLLFLYFRNRIQNVEVEDDEEDETLHPEKKDFSYFR